VFGPQLESLVNDPDLLIVASRDQQFIHSLAIRNDGVEVYFRLFD